MKASAHVNAFAAQVRILEKCRNWNVSPADDMSDSVIGPSRNIHSLLDAHAGMPTHFLVVSLRMACKLSDGVARAICRVSTASNDFRHIPPRVRECLPVELGERAHNEEHVVGFQFDFLRLQWRQRRCQVAPAELAIDGVDIMANSELVGLPALARG